MTVKAGTWGLRTFQKITAMQELAGRTKCPLLYLIDSAGARIDEQRASYAGRKAWGNIFYNQIQLSGVVPQVCVLLGPSPAGTAYQPALCDVCIMVEGNATAYIGSPPMSELVTGYARLGGRPVGIVANQSRYKGGVLFPDSSDKAARFIWTCNAFNVPLLFLQDIPGFMVGSQVERAGMIRHGAKMLFAVAEARVPRIAVLVRKAYGGGYLARSGSPMGPDAVLALPTAKPALMGPESAINAIYLNKIMELPEDQRAAFIDAKRREYEEDIDVYEVASDFSIEAVIPSDDLRDELIRRYEIYSRKDAPPPNKRNGVIPV